MTKIYCDYLVFGIQKLRDSIKDISSKAIYPELPI